jgi:hypothetical protein
MVTTHIPKTKTVTNGLAAATTYSPTKTAVDSPTALASRCVWAVARLSMGWVFLWPFLDKPFGLGHEAPRLRRGSVMTPPAKAPRTGSVHLNLRHTRGGCLISPEKVPTPMTEAPQNTGSQ